MPSFSFLFLFHCSFFLPYALSDPRAQRAALLCTNRTVLSLSRRQVFIANFLAAMDALTPLTTSHGHGAVSNGSQNATVYAFGECMRDLSRNDCNLCLAQCKTQLLACLPFQRGTRGGRLFFDGCYLRYDDYNFFGETRSDQDTTLCGNNSNNNNSNSVANSATNSSSGVYKANVMALVLNLSELAPKSDGFFVGSVERKNVRVYGLAQCWEYVNGSACERCLADAVTRIGSCATQEARVLNAGCYLRYSAQKFYNNSSVVATAGKHGKRRLAKILAASSAALALLLVIATVVFFIRKNVVTRRRERRQFGALLDSVNKSKLNMPYEVLEKATNYFNEANKLGQGGSGSVYKGVMPDGITVAIKRLSFNTTQWADHFFNESLHDHFSVRRTSQPLTWEIRHKILSGIAEGMAYLHEESHVRIIHRDIKLSNILLEEDFTPKIADFGLARLFPEDKSHISTAIAGTLGYMAPEYVVRGKLTEKADVYSFGVLVIEIVSGKKISAYIMNSSSLLHTVWSLYGSNRLSEVVDPTLEGAFPAEGACQLLQIGLLCAQASAELRPSMSVVVKMVNNDHEIPQPTQPPFMNSGSSEFGKSGLPGYNFQPGSNTQSSGNTISESEIEPR
ncbi:cysteine-rich receptor-like protein kinase 3 isoform X2 [Glycine soja]|uniref:Cysteine-rich receptor-like protein kinase 3 n=1 Tax=Glycine soja TaxID=3848 RepID=A0A445FT01_GLYSO|nr:cysteine-rich receptor-like protein kinase 3 isoform X2 [Glycine soja]RZB52019.1 Cysteine-rich receptor-like protein kinase 3 [Glycine soja]